MYLQLNKQLYSYLVVLTFTSSSLSTIRVHCQQYTIPGKTFEGKLSWFSQFSLNHRCFPMNYGLFGWQCVVYRYATVKLFQQITISTLNVVKASPLNVLPYTVQSIVVPIKSILNFQN